MKNNFNDGYPDLGFSYSNKGRGRLDRWKWMTIVSLGLSVILTVSFVLYVVLHSSTPVDVEPQGEYWRTHENTRLNDDEIDKWLSEWMGGDSEHAGDEIQFDEESIAAMLNSLLEKVYLLDNDSWMYLEDTNTLDFIEYEFEPIINRFPESQDEIYTNYGLEVGRLPKNSSLRSLLVGAGLSYAAADIFLGSYYTIYGAGVAAATAPPTAPAAALIIVGALALLTIVILANWKYIEKIASDLVNFFTEAVPGFLRGAIRDFFNRTFNNAKKQVEISYKNRTYVEVALNTSFVMNTASKNSSDIYIALGTRNAVIILGLLKTGSGSISESDAIEIMSNGPDVYFGGVGKMVVSIYTFLDSRARGIAEKAGGGVPPVKHHQSTPIRQGYIKDKHYQHYHNGAMMAKYPPKPNGDNEKLPHAFYGYMIVRPSVVS